MNYQEFEKKYINSCNKLNPDSKEFKDLQEEIINLGNAGYIYEFAFIKGANIDKCLDALLKTRNAEYIYLFVEWVKVANITKCQDALIEIGKAYYIYQFAKNIKGADINKCQEAIFKTGDKKYINLFKKEILKDNQLNFNQ